jgi:hypothetical protein
MGANVVQRGCPNCGAPVSPQHTLMQCEFCGSPLIVVKPQQAPPPVSPFGAYGGNVMPAPPHDPGIGHGRSGGPMVAVALAGVLVVGAASAFLMIGTRSSHVPEPPPPTVVSPTPEPPPGAAGNPAGGAAVSAQAAALEAQCNNGSPQSCVMAGALYEHAGASGGAADKAKARAMYERACKLGDQSGCHMRDAMR